MYIFALDTKRVYLIRMSDNFDGFLEFISSNIISDRFFFFV